MIDLCKLIDSLSIKSLVFSYLGGKAVFLRPTASVGRTRASQDTPELPHKLKSFPKIHVSLALAGLHIIRYMWSNCDDREVLLKNDVATFS